jgi:uncharacterized protein
MDFFIENNYSEKRFEISVDGYTAYVDYSMEGDVITFIHTKVPFPLSGRGIASTLANYALEYAKYKGWRVIPECPFIKSYIKRHREYESLIRF